jgi:hypothetical protein
METDDPTVVIERKRHGCLTAALIVFGVLSLIASLVNLFGSQMIAAALPSSPPSAANAIMVVGLLGFVGVVGLVLLWRWKRLGLYLYVAVGLIVFGVNLWLLGPTINPFAGLIGVATIAVLVLRQWASFE